MLRAILAAALLSTACGPFLSKAHGQPDTLRAEVGKKAPDFTATGSDGKPFKLSEKIGRDKNIVLLFSRANW